MNTYKSKTVFEISLQEIRAFTVVARLLNFTYSAKRLGISQPALSMAVRQLERKLNTTLFDRSTRAVQLSQSGMLLLPIAERLVENYDRTIAGMREVSEGRHGHITIACPEGVAAQVIAPTLAAFVEQNPDVMVSVHDGDAASVERLMHMLSADFGVTGYWREHPDFVVESLTADRCCVICPPNHRFARRKALSIKDLHNVPIVSLNRDAGIRQLIEAQCNARGIRLVVQYEVARVSTLIEMVSSGLCISVLTVLSTPHNAGGSFRVIPFCESELSYPINIIMRANKMLTPSAQRFVASLRNRFRSGKSGRPFAVRSLPVP